MRRKALVLFVIHAALGLLVGCGASAGGTGGSGGLPDGGEPPDDPVDACALGIASTWQAIQVEILDGHGCTSSLCHGTSNNPEGGLDLTSANAYESLVSVTPQAPVQFDIGQSSVDYKRVFPGDQELSFLYLKLAARTLGHALPQGGGQGMPSGGNEALSQDELAVIEKWIRAGAPKQGVVAGTEHSFECGLTNEPSANKLPPVDPPAPGAGVQFYSGAYPLPAFSEDEVCFGTYYDFTRDEGPQVPEEALVDCPPYFEASTEGCFAFKSSMLGQDPQSHHSAIMPYVGTAGPTHPVWGGFQCLGGTNAGTTCDPIQIGVSVSQGGADCGDRSACASSLTHDVPGCFGWGPTDFVSLNGAGIGGAQEAVSYRHAADGVYTAIPMKGFLVWNSHAFNLTDRDTTIEQWLNLDFALEGDQQFSRQTLVTAGSISMMGVIAPFTHKEVCAKYTFERYATVLSLNSHTHLRGVRFRIWEPPHTPCADPAGPDPFGLTRTCAGGDPPGGTPVYESRLYDDALNYNYEVPRVFDMADAADRTYYFCSVFDNGDQHPEKLKRNSTSVGSKCGSFELACFGGESEGSLCYGDDSVCGSGGECDACPVSFGVTTEDEMFLMTAEYYTNPPE